jgi:beta-galactosidase/beta-glucuronidase
VGRSIHKDQLLWYQTTVRIPREWKGRRILLHFGAVDWESILYINHKKVGMHQGGYDAFSFDITDDLLWDGENTITLSVWDPTDQGNQPRGKQVMNPRGIWYTAVIGIWQTVWLEPVPTAHIVSYRATPDIDKSQLFLEVETADCRSGDALSVKIMEGNKVIAQKSNICGLPMTIPIPEACLWSPSDPFLYDLSISLVRDGRTLDKIDSYFGLRKISLEKGIDGIPRLFLNNKVLFQLGTLDQGWWPDGLYTAPTDEALTFDIAKTKELGFNAIRKHVKVEPARWYHHCDRLGILVWQDMPSGDMRGSKADDGQRARTAQSAYHFEKALKGMMDGLINAPSIVIWVPFNEGWGQFDTIEICNWIAHYDPSRLVDGPSGWIDFPNAGDIQDVHKYPGPDMPVDQHDNRALVLGEFGGLGLPVEEHTWQQKKNWGYRSYETRQDLQQAYFQLIDQIPALIQKGLSAAIYTQTTDVEIEVNGLMTYDREIIKMNVEAIRKKNQSLYQ